MATHVGSPLYISGWATMPISCLPKWPNPLRLCSLSTARAGQAVVPREGGLRLAGVRERVEAQLSPVALRAGEGLVPVQQRHPRVGGVGHLPHAAIDRGGTGLAGQQLLQRSAARHDLLAEVVKAAPLEVRLELGHHEEVDDRERGRRDGEEQQRELVAQRAEAGRRISGPGSGSRLRAP